MSVVGGGRAPGVAESVARQTALRDERARRLETALRCPDPASFERLMAEGEEGVWEHARDFFRHRRLEIDGLPRGSAEAARRFAKLCADPALQKRLSKESAPVRGIMDGAGSREEMTMLDVAARALLKIAEGKGAAQEQAGLSMEALFDHPGLGSAALIAVCERAARQEEWADQPWGRGLGRALCRLEPEAEISAFALFSRLGIETVWRGEGLEQLKAIGAPLPLVSAQSACRRLCEIGSNPQSAVEWVQRAHEAGWLSAEMVGALLSDPGVRGACKAALEAIELAGLAPEARAGRGGLSL